MIRPYSIDDHDDVIQILQTVLPHTSPWNEPKAAVRRKWLRQDGLIWVAQEDDGTLCGIVMAGEDGVRGWIYSLAVHPEFRRLGIGRALLRAAETELSNRGCPKINLQVRPGNEQAEAFYAACGYSGETRRSMGKALPPPSVQTAFGKMVATTPLIDGLELSPLCWNDFGELHRLLNESDVFHRCTGDIPFPYTREALEAWMFQTLEVPCRDSGRIGWAVRDRSRRLIGEVSLLAMTEGQQAEIGYWIGQSFWGRGIATAAARAVCKIGFERFGLHRIHAKVFASNPASSKVLRRLGFQHEGTLRSGYFLDGQPIDDEVYGLLRSEWSS